MGGYLSNSGSSDGRGQRIVDSSGSGKKWLHSGYNLKAEAQALPDVVRSRGREEGKGCIFYQLRWGRVEKQQVSVG